MAILEQAKQLSGGKVFVVNWIAGVVHTELPGFFHQRKAAQRGTRHGASSTPIKRLIPAWLREVYYHLGKLALNDGDHSQSTGISAAQWLYGLRSSDHTGNAVFRRQSLRSCVCAAAHRRDRSRSCLRAVRLRIHGILLRGFQGPASNSSALTRARARISQKVHTKRCKRMRRDCRR